MKWIDIKTGLQEFWKELKEVKFGIAGLILLFIFILIVFINPYIVPFPEGSSRWRDIGYWVDNPRSVPPIWVNWFSSLKYAPSLTVYDYSISEEQIGGMKVKEVVFSYNYSYDIPPTDIIFHCHYQGSPVIVFLMERPDNEVIELIKKPLPLSEGEKIRVAIGRASKIKAYNFGSKFDREEDRISRDMVVPTKIFFSEAKEGIFRNPIPLKGVYKVTAMIILPREDDRVEDAHISFLGSVSGLLGTDNSRRDIWSGIAAGVKWALIIGSLTALISVSVGVIYGVTSAYLGGWQDALMQRIFEIFRSVPLLPLLIVMSAVFKPNIWALIFMMCIFFWVGPVKTVRSIGLQIKEETFIEASRAFGASSSRIIFKHMVPLLLPYAFASMALYIPGAILYEATISLLGLGDATIVTWGQILHDALTGGAVLQGMWWWVVPPGLSIALVGMTFAFIGFAMDKILHPKLRTR